MAPQSLKTMAPVRSAEEERSASTCWLANYWWCRFAPGRAAIPPADVVGKEVLHRGFAAVGAAELSLHRQDHRVGEQVASTRKAALEVTQEVFPLGDVPGVVAQGLHQRMIGISPAGVGVELLVLAFDEGLDQPFLARSILHPDLRLVHVHYGQLVVLLRVADVELLDQGRGLPGGVDVLVEEPSLEDRASLEHFPDTGFSFARAFRVLALVHQTMFALSQIC
mmetsp:Transcript_20751/g.29232  ORF Transcript_20751/g.29232 Transcript_20751/m.29232 type:complete len:223 (-) Transcript_20751:86-754(-)